MKKVIRSEGGFTPAHVDKLRGDAAAFLALCRVPSTQAYSIVTVVDEVGCNILEHAQASFLELELRAGLGNVQLLFRDDGIPFDPTAAVKKQLAMLPGDSEERKLGLYMLVSLGQGLSYERVGSYNELTVIIPTEAVRQEEGLQIDHEPGGPGKAWRLHLRGKLDVFSFVKLKKFLESITEGQPDAKVAIDVAQVEFIASSGWSVLLARRKLSKMQGGDVALCAMSAEIERVYKSMRITALLPSYPDVPSAIRAMEAPPQ